MCRMCEGFSLEDVLALDAATIAEYGFMVVGVDAPDRSEHDPPPWAYTVGLLDAADHPERPVYTREDQGRSLDTAPDRGSE